MDTAFAFLGDGYVLLAADENAGRSILVYKTDQDKIVQLSSNAAMATAGTPADSSIFSEYIQKNIELYRLENSLSLSTREIANYIRSELAHALRKGPYQTNLLIGGYDDIGTPGPSLYFCDYLASMATIPYGAHGYLASTLVALFDRDWSPGLSLPDGVTLARRCVDEMAKRFVIHQPNYSVKVINASGIHVINLSDSSSS